ncbi:hypothetical protein ACZ90_36010 [Streptomyces albus subsp. albus]|nr:hypothetical protein ACZ90_36010 [Streptomyces albus subsp. albus]
MWRLARQARRGWPDDHGAEGPPERCDLCAEPLPEAHRHLLDLNTEALCCACGACGLLFDRVEAGGGGGRAHYRLLPRRRLRLDDFALDEVRWAGLGVPVDLAFFTRAERTGEVTARYPSPLGVTRATVAPAAWQEVSRAHPALPTLADDVEALLVHRAGGAREHWLLPLDDCFRAVAVVRAHWKGLGGGPQVWQQLDTFFRALTASDRPPTTEEAQWASR